MSRIVIAYVNQLKMLNNCVAYKKNIETHLKYRKEIFFTKTPFVIASHKQFKECCNSKRANILIKIKNYSPVFRKETCVLVSSKIKAHGNQQQDYFYLNITFSAIII